MASAAIKQGRPGATEDASAPAKSVDDLCRVLKIDAAPAGRGGTAGQADKQAAADAKAAKAQLDFYLKRVNATAALVASEIGNLARIPGREANARLFQARLDRLAVPKGPTVQQLQALDEPLDRLEEAVATELAEVRTTLPRLFKDAKKVRREYEALFQKVHDREEELAAYPAELAGADGQTVATVAKEVARLRQAADGMYGALRYADALATLKDAAALVNGKVDALDALDKKLRGGAFKSRAFTAAYKALDGFHADIRRAGGLVGPTHAAVATADKLATDLYVTMMKAVERGSGDQDAMGELAQRSIAVSRDGLNAAVKSAGEQKARLDKELLAQRDLLATSGALSPQAEIDRAYGLVAEVEQRMAEFNYAGATETLGQLAELIDGWDRLASAANTKDRDREWQAEVFSRFVKPAKEEEARARRFGDLMATVPVLQTEPTPPAMVAKLLDDQLELFEHDRAAFPLGTAMDVLAKAKALNARFAKLAELFEAPALAELRVALGTRMATRAKEADRAILPLRGPGAAQGDTVPSFDVPLAAAAADWRAGLAQATTPDELQAVFDAVEARLQALAERAKAAAADPGKGDALAKEVRLAREAAALRKQLDRQDEAFRVASEAAGQAMDGLAEVDYETADRQRIGLEAARDRFVAARKAHDIAAADRALGELAGITDAALLAQRAANDGFAAAAASFGRDYAQWETLLADLGRLKGAGDYKGVLAGLGAEAKLLLAVSKTRDASVLRKAQADLAELRGEGIKLHRLLAPAAGATAPAAEGKGALTKRLDAIALDHKDVKALEPAALLAIAARKKAIAAGIPTSRLSVSADAITTLAADWAELQRTAVARRAAIDTFVNDATFTLDGFRTRLDGIEEQALAARRRQDKKAKADKLYAPYRSAMTARIEALRLAATDKHEVDQAGLDRLKKEIADNWNGEPRSLARASQAAEMADMQEELDRGQYEVDLAALKGKLRALDTMADRLADPAGRSAFKEQKQQIADAIGAVEGNILKKVLGSTPPGGYAAKREQLQAQADNIDRLRAYPMGMATHARGQIMPVVEAWAQVVGRFGTVLDALGQAAEAKLAGEPDGPAVRDKVRARLAELKGLLPPGTLAAPAKAVLDAPDAAAARVAREVALREVSRLRALVEGPAFKSAARNPFQVDVLAGLSGLSAALFDVETNLTISL